MPCATAGQIVYLATYRRARRLSAGPSPGSAPAAGLHHVRGLPGAQHDLADPAHRLRVGADDGDGAEVVQQVLGGHRGRSDPALGEGQVLRHAGVEVVADHQHVEVLGQGVAGVRAGSGWSTTAARSGAAATVMMSGACPPPAPSVW